MRNKCEQGYSCGDACIERRDDCKIKLSNKVILNKLHNARSTAARGGFNDVQQQTYNTIKEKMRSHFNSPDFDEAFAKAAASHNTADEVKLTGDIRHQLRAKDGSSYDSILDAARASSGLDNQSWNKVYGKAKNVIEGQLVKRLLASKGNCE